MSHQPEVRCAHVDRKARWLGLRRVAGRKVYVFQCTACGATFHTHSPIESDAENGQLMSLSSETLS